MLLIIVLTIPFLSTALAHCQQTFSNRTANLLFGLGLACVTVWHRSSACALDDHAFFDNPRRLASVTSKHHLPHQQHRCHPSRPVLPHRSFKAALSVFTRVPPRKRNAWFRVIRSSYVSSHINPSQCCCFRRCNRWS